MQLVTGIDLHLHTDASDGSWTPADLWAEARARSARIIAVTDHDATAGLLAVQALAAADPSGPTVLSGIEITCDHRESGRLVHLLAYGVDPRDPVLTEVMAGVRRRRLAYVEEQVERIRREGYPITFAQVQGYSRSDTVYRVHILEALRAAGVIGSFADQRRLYPRLFGRDGVAYVAEQYLEVAEAISLVREIGAVPVLAHPGPYRCADLIRPLADQGLAGVEAYYPFHGPEQTALYLTAARELGLLVSGGTDQHGRYSDTPVPLAGMPVPPQVHLPFLTR